MTNFPSSKLMILITLMLLLGFGYKYSKSFKDNFYQLRYDWNNLKELKCSKIIEIEKLNYNSLQLTMDKPIHPNNQNTYSLNGKEKYYFRHAYSEINGNKISFLGVTWVNQQPESIDDLRYLSEIEISLKKNENAIRVITIGDKLIHKDEAKYFRKEMFKHRNIAFYGIQKDVFNTCYLDISNSDSFLFNNKNVDIIIVFSSRFSENLYTYIFSFLKNPSKKVFVFTPPEETKKLEDKNNGFDSNRFKQFKNAQIISVEELFNGDSIYKKKGELTMQAYKKLAEVVSKKIKE